jgi:peptidoglycan hydrolase-like protein with peptidoglycan-binding domain
VATEERRSGRHLLRSLRERVGLTQARLADLAGYSERAISDIERGEKVPREGTVRKLAEALARHGQAQSDAGEEAAFAEQVRVLEAAFRAEARPRGTTSRPLVPVARSVVQTEPSATGAWLRDRPRRSAVLAGLAALGCTALLLGLALPRVAAPPVAIRPESAQESGAGFPTLSLGSQGVDVLAMQLLLRHRGHDEVVAYGVFGPDTGQAVRTFQGESGLSADAIVGAQTWQRLLVNVREGSQGEAVRAVQAQLNRKRSAGLTEDGVFDATTRAAVLDFQRWANIAVDGIVGPETWQHLLTTPAE